MEQSQKAIILVSVLFIFALVFVICCFSGCSTEPPAMNQVEKLFLKYESDFCTVSMFLTSLPAETAHISKDNGEIYIDRTDQIIEDPSIIDSLQHLWKAGCSSIYMNRANNSISFVLWRTGLVGDASAGLLYAIDTDEDNLPTTQFLTELQPMQTNAWYYYVADYEEWRIDR